jgi:hypothetical protein
MRYRKLRRTIRDAGRIAGIASVRFYGSRRIGPESVIEDAVVERARELFHAPRRITCILGSRQIGNGLPDLTIVCCRPMVRDLPDLTGDQSLLLGYLRLVNRVSASTLAAKLQMPETRIDDSLAPLVSTAIVRQHRQSFSISPLWRDLLAVATVEAKSTDWRRAITQALRNTVFANQSYVALPERHAENAASDSVRHRLGIGVISVTDSGCAEIRARARLQRPLVWRHYFDLASEAARNLQRA